MIQSLDIESMVLDAADRLLARGEYPRMGLEAIAHEAGVSPDVLYPNFRTKEDVLLAHFDRIVRRIVAVENEIAAQPEPAVLKIRQILMFRVLAYFDSVQHFADSLNDLCQDIRSELADRRRLYLEWEAEVIELVLQEVRSSRQSPVYDIPGTARALLAATDSLLAVNWVSSEQETRTRVVKKASRVTELVTDGLLEVAKRPRNHSIYILAGRTSYLDAAKSGLATVRRSYR